MNRGRPRDVTALRLEAVLIGHVSHGDDLAVGRFVAVLAADLVGLFGVAAEAHLLPRLLAVDAVVGSEGEVVIAGSVGRVVLKVGTWNVDVLLRPADLSGQHGDDCRSRGSRRVRHGGVGNRDGGNGSRTKAGKATSRRVVLSLSGAVRPIGPRGTRYDPAALSSSAASIASLTTAIAVVGIGQSQ